MGEWVAEGTMGVVYLWLFTPHITECVTACMWRDGGARAPKGVGECSLSLGSSKQLFLILMVI